jgi:uncharacterized protein with HEPN domain
MSSRDWKDRIQDILDAIEEIFTFTKGMDFESFQNDTRTVRAVELDLIIICEAANSIPGNVQDAHPEIPWQMMRAIRNRLVHVYFSTDPRILWDTIQKDLPPLVPILRKLI